MTDYEICQSYRSAKFPRKQIGILAQLNDAEIWDIRDILKRNGIDADVSGCNHTKGISYEDIGKRIGRTACSARNKTNKVVRENEYINCRNRAKIG